ncbi:MAG: type II secretion system secretin GspD [Candidatus Hydrogenedentes bacterium]|nr:type II secretion system secretin GspD [Candidatus Hydrogenedentota bacterium]
MRKISKRVEWERFIATLNVFLFFYALIIFGGYTQDQLGGENIPVVQEAPSVPEGISPPPQSPVESTPPPEAPPNVDVPPPPSPESVPKPIPSFPTVRRDRQSPPTPPLPRRASNAPTVPSGGSEKSQVGLATDQSIPKTGETPSEPISFDFHDAPLYDVIAAIARLTGRNFDVDPNIGATTVTVITHDKIPPEMAYQVLESILSSRGFSMVETLGGKLIKIIATPDAVQSEKTPLIKGTEKLPEGYDKFATHIVTLKYADASEVSSALQVLGSKSCRISAYAPTNTLIITDTADGLRRIFTFLGEIDVPGNETETEIFMLEYTRAEALAQQLEQVLSETRTTAVGGRVPTAGPVPQPVVRPPTRAVPGAPAMQIIGSRQEVLRMVPDTRLNALIVVATAGMMEKVRDLIKRLDCPTPYEANNLHIYELLNADAEKVEQALQPLISGSGSMPARRPTTTGAPGAPQPVGAVGGAASSAPGEVQPFEQRVQITRYDQTNSLLIVASPQDYKVLEAFIARLDVPQRQVLVDAVVMDVKLNNDYGVKVDAASISGHSGFVESGTGNILKIVESLKPAADAANKIVNPSRLNLMMGALGLGSGGGLTTGIYDDIVIPISATQRLRIPFVPVLLQAIETVSDLEVLSQPSLVTVDNEEASIVVGQEVPFITSTASPQRTATGEVITGTWGGYTRVERKEVGIKLTVTPQISEGDNVLLKIEIEVSAVAGANQSVGSVDILGPTTNKSLFKNQVLVKDGSTAVLAGLIRDTADRTQTQVPVLGDLPLLGFLFRNRSVTREKRNMVVLVTPHIVKESSDLERITQYKVMEYQDVNVQELFKAGFFKKVKTKSSMRKNYRPTLDRTEALTGQVEREEFNKGTIYRK